MTTHNDRAGRGAVVEACGGGGLDLERKNSGRKM